jgi:hypothetical protein
MNSEVHWQLTRVWSDLARDDQSLATTLAGYHWLAFAVLMLKSLFAKSA